MEVESTGATASDASKNKILFVILGVLGVAIVGLTIAIIVVKNMPKNNIANEDAPGDYYTISNEVWDKIVNNNSEMTAEETLALYEKRIEGAKDEETKLMLTMDYYGFVMMYDTEGSRKNEVIDAMLAADEKLKTPLSASNVISMAISYDDHELQEKYEIILNERISAMDDGHEEDTELEDNGENQ